jgi:hypothetical protein
VPPQGCSEHPTDPLASRKGKDDGDLHFHVFFYASFLQYSAKKSLEVFTLWVREVDGMV